MIKWKFFCLKSWRIFPKNEEEVDEDGKEYESLENPEFQEVALEVISIDQGMVTLECTGWYGNRSGQQKLSLKRQKDK